MERRLTYFEAADYREMGFHLVQLTDEATSLHAKELYRISAAPPAPPPEEAPVLSRVMVVPAGTWEAVFTDAAPEQEGCEPCPGDAGLSPEDLSGPCPW